MKVYCFETDKAAFISPDVGFMNFVKSYNESNKKQKTFLCVDKQRGHDVYYFTVYDGKNNYFIEHKENNCCIFAYVDFCKRSLVTSCRFVHRVEENIADLMIVSHLEYQEIKANSEKLSKYMLEFIQLN